MTIELIIEDFNFPCSQSYSIYHVLEGILKGTIAGDRYSIYYIKMTIELTIEDFNFYLWHVVKDKSANK